MRRSSHVISLVTRYNPERVECHPIRRYTQILTNREVVAEADTWNRRLAGQIGGFREIEKNKASLPKWTG